MRIVVTGGAGFIGSNAAAAFFAKGHEIVCVDNLSRRGADRNLEWLRRTTKIAFERLDLRQADPTAAFFKSARPDVVLHCAGQVAVTSSVTDPRRDFEDNALGTFNVLEGIRGSGRKPLVIYTSTNKVYGGMEDVAIDLADGRYHYRDLLEGVGEDRPLDFHSPYGCSKGTADQYVRDYGRIYGIPTVVFRQSCIYGPRQFGVEDQGWVAWFIIAVQLGRRLTIFGDGMQARDVLHVDDLVGAFEAVIDRREAARGEIFNIGGGPRNQLSLLELIAQLEKIEGKRIEWARADWRPGDQKVFVCRIEKAKRQLGWEPRTGVAEGVRKLHGWVKANLHEIAAALDGEPRAPSTVS